MVKQIVWLFIVKFMYQITKIAIKSLAPHKYIPLKEVVNTNKRDSVIAISVYSSFNILYG